MRYEAIRCDTCNKEHDPQYYLPKEWIVTKQRDQHGCDEEKHFCSKTCLIKWASEGQIPTSGNGVAQEALDHVEECMDILHTSIMIGLHPQESATGPAGIMSQMMVVENVKEDYKKLRDAINALRKEGENE